MRGRGADNTGLHIQRPQFNCPIMDREEAPRDYHARSVDIQQKIHVTVTETFQLTIEIEAESRQRAEQIVSADWRKQVFVLGPEDFAGVEFKTELAFESRELS